MPVYKSTVKFLQSKLLQHSPLRSDNISVGSPQGNLPGGAITASIYNGTEPISIGQPVALDVSNTTGAKYVIPYTAGVRPYGVTVNEANVRINISKGNPVSVTAVGSGITLALPANSAITVGQYVKFVDSADPTGVFYLAPSTRSDAATIGQCVANPSSVKGDLTIVILNF